MQDFAPNYHRGLAEHEWRKHGTCSNLSPKLYFQEGLRAMLMIRRTKRGTPLLIQENVGGSLTSEKLRECYDYDIGIKVSDKCALEEITTCWNKAPNNGKVGKQINCPKYVMKGHRNNCDNKKCKGIIKITKLGHCIK